MTAANDFEDRIVDVHDPEVPPGIRRDVLANLPPGGVLMRCPRREPAHGLAGLLGLGRDGVTIEWWLLDADGELIDIYWNEP